MAEGNGFDALPGFELLLSCPTGLSPFQVNVDFAEAYDRIPHPDVNPENSIAEIWSQKLQSNPSLYNGQKFRFGGFSTCNTSRGSEQVSNVFLKLGLTDYRTFIGTNLSPLWEKFLVPSKDDTVRCQHTASPLGNGSIVITSDQKILILRRSNKVGEFPGHFVFPGGHPECDPLLIGISQRRLNVRPAAFFFMEVQHLYGSAQDGFESTKLYAVSGDDLKSMVPKMPGCHQGGCALYRLMIDARKGS